MLTWISLENTKLTEINQTNTSYSYVEPKEVKHVQAKIRMVVGRVWGKWGDLCNEYKVLFRMNEL